VAVLCSFIFTISVYGLSLYFIIVCIFMRIKMVILPYLTDRPQ